MRSYIEKGRKEVTEQKRRGGRKALCGKIFAKGSLEMQIRKREQLRERGKRKEEIHKNVDG